MKKTKSKDENGPEMKKFTCTACNKEFPDTKLYFFDIPSKKCIYCTKFPKKTQRTFA